MFKCAVYKYTYLLTYLLTSSLGPHTGHGCVLYCCFCTYNRTSGGNDFWIGLYKSAPAATDNCYWLDGNNSTFRNWIGSEPNSATDMCIRMVSGGFYRDIACSQTYGYICKADKGIRMHHQVAVVAEI